MAKISGDYRFKKREGNVLFYPYRNMMVARTISGFTTEALKTSPKYEANRQAAKEFGKVSSLCKTIRVALQGLLPKQNNLAVVNAFTKKMRQVLSCDTQNERGNRTLTNAIATPEGIALLKGYEFNPDSKIGLEYHLEADAVSVSTQGLQFPKNATTVGFRVHQLRFDFTNTENVLQSSDWVQYSKTALPETLALTIPLQSDAKGVLFTIVESQALKNLKGGFVPAEDVGGRSVVVVGVV